MTMRRVVVTLTGDEKTGDSENGTNNKNNHLIASEPSFLLNKLPRGPISTLPQNTAAAANKPSSSKPETNLNDSFNTDFDSLPSTTTAVLTSTDMIMITTTTPSPSTIPTPTQPTPQIRERPFLQLLYLASTTGLDHAGGSDDDDSVNSWDWSSGSEISDTGSSYVLAPEQPESVSASLYLEWFDSGFGMEEESGSEEEDEEDSESRKMMLALAAWGLEFESKSSVGGEIDDDDDDDDDADGEDDKSWSALAWFALHDFGLFLMKWREAAAVVLLALLVLIVLISIVFCS